MAIMVGVADGLRHCRVWRIARLEASLPEVSRPETLGFVDSRWSFGAHRQLVLMWWYRAKCECIWRPQGARMLGYICCIDAST